MQLLYSDTYVVMFNKHVCKTNYLLYIHEANSHVHTTNLHLLSLSVMYYM